MAYFAISFQALAIVIWAIVLPFQDVPKNENEWTDLIAETEMQTYQTQARLFDGTRPDLLGALAIEVDWTYKWKEGIGQASYYSAISGKPAGLLLLAKDLKENRRDIYKAIIAAKHANVLVLVYDCQKQKFVKFLPG